VRRQVPAKLGEETVDEKTIYADARVTITSNRVVVTGTTYALRDIASVRMTTTKGERFFPSLVAFGGLVMSPVAFGLMGDDKPGLGVVWLFFCVAAMIVGVYCAVKVRDTYHLAITGARGELRAYSSRDGNYMRALVEHINTAIMHSRAATAEP
jgi:hypothetical protein